ncbi:MAG: hypothetical protein V3V62_15170, partial [bacterium]
FRSQQRVWEVMPHTAAGGKKMDGAINFHSLWRDKMTYGVVQPNSATAGFPETGGRSGPKIRPGAGHLGIIRNLAGGPGSVVARILMAPVKITCAVANAIRRERDRHAADNAFRALNRHTLNDVGFRRDTIPWRR